MPSGSQSQSITTNAGNSSSASFSGPHPGLTKLMTDMYGNALSLNSEVYQDILGGYDRALNENRARGDISQTQYGDLARGVMQTIQGQDTAERQRIESGYQTSLGQTQQGLINSGLGNSTIGANLDRGLLSDKNRADMDLTGRTSGQQAGYLASLLGSGIQAQQQSAQLAAQQYGNYNSALAGWKSPYPTWAPNYSDSTSTANNSSTSTSYQVSQNLPDQSAPGPPAGLNAGTPGPLYGPGAVPGSSNAANAYENAIKQVSNANNYNGYINGAYPRIITQG